MLLVIEGLKEQREREREREKERQKMMTKVVGNVNANHFLSNIITFSWTFNIPGHICFVAYTSWTDEKVINWSKKGLGTFEYI